MTEEEIKAIETHIEIHAKAEPRAIKITEILRKAVRELRENKELKEELTKKADTNHSLVEQMADLESENAELKEKVEKVTELIEDMYDKIPASHSDYYKDVMERARQFLWG